MSHVAEGTHMPLHLRGCFHQLVFAQANANGSCQEGKAAALVQVVMRLLLLLLLSRPHATAANEGGRRFDVRSDSSSRLLAARQTLRAEGKPGVPLDLRGQIEREFVGNPPRLFQYLREEDVNGTLRPLESDGSLHDGRGEGLVRVRLVGLTPIDPHLTDRSKLASLVRKLVSSGDAANAGDLRWALRELAAHLIAISRLCSILDTTLRREGVTVSRQEMAKGHDASASAAPVVSGNMTRAIEAAYGTHLADVEKRERPSEQGWTEREAAAYAVPSIELIAPITFCRKLRLRARQRMDVEWGVTLKLWALALYAYHYGPPTVAGKKALLWTIPSVLACQTSDFKFLSKFLFYCVPNTRLTRLIASALPAPLELLVLVPP
eukprot:GHVU01158734.1.p1 GENE.GHVU01158734.1~~GHVU01158734.1.p1  ORF type:complete len:379 (+),score=33.14 GHVU01158734.1:217-1353(+)